jgi:hypothetical protein
LTAVALAAAFVLTAVARAEEKKKAEETPSAEVRLRAKAILDKLDRAGNAAARLGMIRAVEVLEEIGTSEANQVLEALVKGAPEARLTQEAKASLRRLSSRPAAVH